MADGLNPLNEAKGDLEKHARRLLNRLIDFRKTYLTWVVLKLTGGSAVALAAAIYSLHAFAWIAGGVMFVAFAVHAIYAGKMLKDKDRQLRFAWVENKRLSQRSLDREIAMDNVILELMGERPSQRRAFRSAPPELRSALAHVTRRVADAEARAAAAEAVKEGTATNAQRRALRRFQRSDSPSSAGPALEPIRKRRDARSAARAALEAEIQALPTAESIEQAMEAEEAKGARRTARERRDAARKAEQAAWDRKRAGRPATAERPGAVISLAVKANGERDVRKGTAPPTPEQIAQGEDTT